MVTEVDKLLASAHVKPNSFEAELGLLCHKWITLQGLDPVIAGLDAEVEALEGRRDLEVTNRPPPEAE